MELPHFGPWTPWAARYDIKDWEQPGVYLLGKFDSRPQVDVEPISSSVIYIGETCDQNLAKRWYQFNRSAFEQKPGHSGGWTFSARYCNNCVTEPVFWLYVAALPVLLDDPHRSAYTRYVERWLIWQYVQKFNTLPACNSK
jgi:hypothetical protein